MAAAVVAVDSLIAVGNDDAVALDDGVVVVVGCAAAADDEVVDMKFDGLSL